VRLTTHRRSRGWGRALAPRRVLYARLTEWLPEEDSEGASSATADSTASEAAVSGAVGEGGKDPIESTDDDGFECSAAKMAAKGFALRSRGRPSCFLLITLTLRMQPYTVEI